MKTIWKYELTVGKNKINLPWGSQVLTVQMQDGKPYIWVLLDPKEKEYPHIFEIYGTGHTIEDSQCNIYIGTWQDGPYVWHLFKSI